MALRARDSQAKALETGNDGRVPDPDAEVLEVPIVERLRGRRDE